MDAGVTDTLKVVDNLNGADIAQLILLSVTALGAFMAAFFTLFAARSTKTASRGATMLDCLDKYITIMKDKRKAMEEKKPQLAEEFYRELFDLHWSEFHLWHENVIPNKVMHSWLYIRKRNFNGDKILCKFEGGKEENVTYREQWEKAKSENYFEINDPFIKFMDRAHSEAITDIKNSRKKQVNDKLQSISGRSSFFCCRAII